MNKKKIIEYGIAVTRIYLALVFVISGLEKINDFSSFAQSIENYRILPIYFVNIIAIIIPWLEVVAGAFLLLGIYIKENSIIILLLLSIFTLGVLSAVFRNLDIDCGCHSTSNGQKVGLLKILENISLIVVAFLSIKFPRQVLAFYKQQ
jgi:uncharacterized membrane protein YphA (DoxX/SURF4 family)